MMTSQQYKDLSDEIDRECNARHHHLRQIYVEENAQFKIGDFICNVTGIIKVEKISFKDAWENVPTITYCGLRYKKVKGELIRTKDNKISTLIHNLKLVPTFENQILP
jgi:hypothetical protein